MSWRIIRALVVKDLALFFRNRFFAFVSLLGVAAYAGIYFLMPSSVDETLTFAVYAPDLPPTVQDMLEQEGLIFKQQESLEALRATISQGDLQVGLSIPDGFLNSTSPTSQEIQVFYSSTIPSELQDTYTVLIQELIYMMSGSPFPLEIREEILGTDRAGEQIPQRDRMLPLFGVMILMVETLGLASLITEEIESGTLRALLTTPASVVDVFAGKGITGVGLAFLQTTAFMAITGGLTKQPLLIISVLLLGSCLVTGVAFLMASASKDMMAVFGWGILAIILLSIPTFNVMIPGPASNWIKAIPSYYMVDAVHRTVNYGARWGDIRGDLLALFGFVPVIITLGIVALRRRFR